jgi:peptidoglycan/LPS O-acetylase OafA/YrhL
MAVLAVISFHAGHLTGGYLGVDLFFVLSGFLITSLLLDEQVRSGTIALGRFWIRRARRLLPALLVMLLAVAVYAALWATPPELTGLRGDSIATLFYVANWHAIASSQSYWMQYAMPSPLEHTWSLAIEEQFYLVWPIVAMLVLGRGNKDRERGARRLLVVALAGAVVSTVLMASRFRAGHDVTRIYFGTDTRAGGILLGASLACVLSARGPARSALGRRAVAVGGWLGAAVLLAAWDLLGGQSAFAYRGGFLVCEIACVLVIAAVAVPVPGSLARVLSFSPLRGVGLISYGLYLWHFPVFVWLTGTRTGLSGWTLLTARLVVTLVIALLSYHLVELPVRRGNLSPVTLRRMTPVAVAGVLLALVVATVPVAPAVTVDQAAAAIPTLGPLPARPASGPTTTESRKGVPRVLVVGDSVGDSVAQGMVPFQQRFGIDVRSLARVGCGLNRTAPRIRLLDGTESSEASCLGTQQEWRSTIASYHPDVVLSVLGWPGNTERYVDGSWRRPCDPVYDRWYANEVAAGLHVLTAGGARVFVTTVPYYRSPNAPLHTDHATDCLNRTYRAQAAAAGAGVIDLAGYVCPGAQCRVTRDGVVLRPDGLHFSGASSVWAATWILQKAWSHPT